LTGSSALLAFGSAAVNVLDIIAFVACAAVGAGAVVLGARRSVWGFRMACALAVADVGLLAVAQR
jgi:hypothetical protein